MADNKVHPTATEMDYPAHFKNYDAFTKLFKIGALVRVSVRRVWLSMASSYPGQAVFHQAWANLRC